MEPSANATHQQSPTAPNPLEERSSPLPVMLILVGLPGSGKSSFCSSLIDKTSECGHRWVRVNQDSIRAGQRGTRQECLSAATAAVQKGYSVLIDRTNCTPDQRQDFIKLARGLGLSNGVHCLVFDLPRKVCADRAAQRSDHEGGVQDKRAYGVVGKLAKQMQACGPPNEAKEGLDSVLICRNDEEIDAAVEMWTQYSCSHCSGHGGNENQDEGHDKDRGTVWNPEEEWKKHFAERRKAIFGAKSSKNAFDVMMRAAALEATSSKRRKYQDSEDANAASRKHDEHFESLHTHFAAKSPFINALQQYADQPERFPKHAIYEVDSEYVIVPDKYPKSRHHALVISRDTRLQGPLDLSSKDIPLVKRMKEAAERWATATAPTAQFAFGFHSVPSMRRLHLHVISRDYGSPCLKTKRHWNSFCSSFFLDVDWVIKELSIRPGATPQSNQGNKSFKATSERRLCYDIREKEALLQSPLRCHACGQQFDTLAQLRVHLKSCSEYVERFLHTM